MIFWITAERHMPKEKSMKKQVDRSMRKKNIGIRRDESVFLFFPLINTRKGPTGNNV